MHRLWLKMECRRVYDLPDPGVERLGHLSESHDCHTEQSSFPFFPSPDLISKQARIVAAVLNRYIPNPLTVNRERINSRL